MNTTNTVTDHPRLDVDELSRRVTPRPGPLGHAGDHVTDAAAYMAAALYEGGERDTAAPSDVCALIDEALGVLHTIRGECVLESRRRLDAAMKSSARLLGLDEEGT